MMSDFQRINRDRPTKIVDMLRVIDASARSNKATHEEVRALLQPVYEKLGDGARTTAPVPQTPPPAAPEAPARPGVVAAHDGLLVTALGRLLKDHNPDALRGALDWVIRHRGL